MGRDLPFRRRPRAHGRGRSLPQLPEREKDGQSRPPPPQSQPALGFFSPDGAFPAGSLHTEPTPPGTPRPQQREATVSEVKVLTAFAAPPWGGRQSCQPVCPGLRPGGSGVVTARGQRGSWNPQPAEPCGRCLWTEPPPPLTDGMGRSSGLEGVLRGRRHSPSPSSTMAWMTTGNTPRSRSKFS